MTIEIRGTGTRNKGAQLMLEAIVERLGTKLPLAAPTFGSDYSVRAQLGLLQSIYEPKFPRLSMALGNRVPKSVRVRYGLVAEKEITGVLDASGFALSDSFPIKSLESAAALSQTRARRDISTIMLPQAFGPFQDPAKRELSRKILENANLIFVRDTISAAYLDMLNLTTPVELQPDFTIDLDPSALARVEPNPFVALVPNSMMIKTGVVTKARYLDVLKSYGETAKEQGLNVVVVVHETGDSLLAKHLANALQAAVFEHREPRCLKAALGQAELVVSSRFHAVVGGLSQGVPTIALGWSHKYLELLRDFGVEDWLASVDDDAAQLVNAVLADKEGHERLGAKKQALRSRIAKMWDRTEQVLRRETS